MKKVIVISGGSDGVGKTLAENLSRDYIVIILARNEENLKSVAETNHCGYRVCDVSIATEVQTAVESIIHEYKKIDVLINNAGIWIEGALETNDPANIQKVLEVNTLGTILLSRQVLPFMKKEKQGIIMNVISQAGLNGKPERSVYNASKWAITGFTKSLEMEVSKDGIRVIGLYPSKLKTNMFKKLGIEKSMDGAMSTIEMYTLVKFILNLPDNITIPDVTIKEATY